MPRAADPLCAGHRAGRGGPAPDDPALGRRVGDLRRRLADVTALFEAGKSEQALEPARVLAADASALGYRALEAEVLLRLARVENRLGKPAVAEESLYRALGASQAGRASRIAVEAWLDLGWIAYRQKRRDDANRVALLARGALERVGGDAGLESILEGLIGVILSDQGKLAEARGHLQRSLEVSEKGGESRLATEAHKRLAALSAMQGDLEGALGQQRRAIALAEKVSATASVHRVVPRQRGRDAGPAAPPRRVARGKPARARAGRGDRGQGQPPGRPHPQQHRPHLPDAQGDGAALPWFERSLAVKEMIHGRDHPEAPRSSSTSPTRT